MENALVIKNKKRETRRWEREREKEREGGINM